MSKLWLGAETTHDAAIEALAKIEAYRSSGSTEPNLPPPYQILQGVAIVPVSGSLVPGEFGPYASWYGVTGYGDITNAMVLASQDPAVTAILLDVNSGGGAVSGVTDAYDTVSKVGKLKPVHAYVSGMAASAAYWTIADAASITVAPTAVVGSIGTIITHMERSKQLAEDGIGVTVVRSGEFKALASSVEPLSPEALKSLQELADATNKVFHANVADSRKMTTAKLEATAGLGREFVGQSAVDIGLADAAGSFSEALSKAMQAGALASKTNANYNSGKKGSTPMKATLTPEQLAAVAAGLPMGEVELEASTETPVEPTPETPEAEVPAAAPEASTPVLDMLKAQLAESQAAHLQASIKLAAAEAQAAQAADQLPGLLAIARASIGQMSLIVAPGSTLEAAQAIPAAQVLAEHTRISELFKSKIKVGGVSAASPDATKPEVTQENVSPLFLRAVQSARK